MKLTLGKKIVGGFFIVLLLINIIHIFTVWESSKITLLYQEFSKNQINNLKISQAVQFYIVVININIIVLLIVISLLASREKYRPVSEFMAATSKIADNDLPVVHPQYKSSDEIRFSSR